MWTARSADRARRTAGRSSLPHAPSAGRLASVFADDDDLRRAEHTYVWVGCDRERRLAEFVALVTRVDEDSDPGSVSVSSSGAGEI
jgi:hypothetical protein